MSHVNHKLSGSLEGALAGGGDPATSPLYVFGPFLKLIVAAGLGSVVMGAAVWLAVLTVVVVGLVYRRVMTWITDGSGGSGLCEDEFGTWAVILNAGITVIEYTLTFLVSVAALVTFLADRFVVLKQSLLGVPAGLLVALGITVAIGFAVNLGPKVAARTFGPATAAVLLLLWVMIGATIWQRGLHFPSVHWEAFSSENISTTLGGYSRILALMTGIEIFANLVAAYEGPSQERSRKAFGSLVIVMGTTSLTMLIVGPAIFALADPNNAEVSVFTQTMDALLPAPLPYLGTLIGVAVLASAAAAAAQGAQNLSLGLRYRHYIPAWLGERNRYGVAAPPVWLMVAVCVLCFLVFGTHEETYLALYAAGVFILLSLTGWATVKRLLRENRRGPTLGGLATLGGVMLAALLTSGATVVIFEERFTEGAWMYVVILPLLYVAFRRIRSRLGTPPTVGDRLGQLISTSYLPQYLGDKLYAGVDYAHILVPLDQSPLAELALAQAQTMARHYNGSIKLMTVLDADAPPGELGATSTVPTEASSREYLDDVQEDLASAGYPATTELRSGTAATEIVAVATAGDVDLVVISNQGRSRLARLVQSHVTMDVIHETTPPLLLIRPTDDWRSTRTRFKKLLVALDGSSVAEQVLPHVHELASKFQSEVTLLCAPEGSQEDDFVQKVEVYLEKVAALLREKGVETKTLVIETSPVQALLAVSKEQGSDLIMLASHGAGGVERQAEVRVGSVVEAVLQEAPCPVFLVSAVPEPNDTPTAPEPSTPAGGPPASAG
ncbi:MAG: universal stress protein [Planctomycetes bacterium]|nr:universal stress protein [Planctomycetota bacterium]